MPGDIVKSVIKSIKDNHDSIWGFYYFQQTNRTSHMIDAALSKYPELTDRFMMDDCTELGAMEALAIRGEL